MLDTPLVARNAAGWPLALIDRSVFTGAVFWVGSAVAAAYDDTSHGRHPDKPFATLDYAIGQCTASAGDVVFLLPGHAEDIASATGCVLDIAGVEVIGLGRGSLQPAFTLTTAAGATISITAADCAIRNVRVTSEFTNGVTAGITLAAGADGCVLEDVLMTETLVTQEYLIGISIAADCDDVTIRRLRYCGIAGGSTTSAIAAAGGTDRTVIEDCYIQVDASAAALKLDAAASTDLQILGNRVINIDTGAGLGIDTHASSTGWMIANLVANLKDTVAGVSGAGMAYCENRGTNALNASGIVKPANDS